VLDIHTHVLPGLDDGAPDIDAGVALCRRLREVGVDMVVATPHWCSPRFRVVDHGIASAWAELERRVAAEVPGLRLSLGAEHHCSGLQDAASFVATLRPLGGGRCVLIELPDDHLPATTWSTLFAVSRAGFRAVLAHPERCKGLSRGDDSLRAYVEGGGLLQLTLGHLIGAHGLIMRWKSRAMLKRFPQACVIASDSHDLKARRPRWDELPERWRHLVPADLGTLERWGSG
jgi:protein-tyrosine phosphatase